MLRTAAIVLVYLVCALGAALALLTHGKPLAGRFNCLPTLAAAMIEFVLISIIVWG